jgi:CheY-like chemotaxis protein
VRLRQVLLNLIGNAVKFTERGEVIVRVSVVASTASWQEATKASAAGTCELEISVTDTGIGIPRESLREIFRSFTQADGSLARRYGGTGLGLAICRQIVDLMGGRIQVESEVGRGSRFWLRVPVEVVAGADSALEGADSLRAARVLVVDDNTTNRQILLHHLASWGAETEESADGPSALEALRRAQSAGRPFALVVLDMMMPGMTGLDVARAVRQDAGLTAPQMVILTSAGSALTAGEEQELDIAATLSKPVRKAELQRTFVRAFSRTSGDAARRPVAVPSSRASLAGLRVLLAEDNEINQKLTLSVLRSFGCETLAAGDGAAALEALGRQRFDVVLMDCQMPNLDGFAATREIRRREAAQAGGPRIPVIALTAHAMRSDREECLAAGMDDYLSKPFAKEHLFELLARWTRQPDPAWSAEPGEPPRDPVPAAIPAAGGGADAPSLDLGVLRSIAALDPDPEFSAEIIRRFVAAAGEVAEKLQAAASRNDFTAIGRAAHTLKSTSGQVGAMRLSQLCRTLEEKMRSGLRDGSLEDGRPAGPGGPASVVDAIRAEVDTVVKRLADQGLGVGHG